MKYLICISTLLSSFLVNAQNRILVDGDFGEWTEHLTIYTDANGDEGSSGIDFGKTQISNDDAYLFFSIETGIEINLQDFNEVSVHLDLDNDVSTGNSRNGLGIDLSYNFGNRSGTYYSSGSSTNVRQSDIGLITAPTVTSDRFEIAIKRSFSVNGNQVYMNDSINVLFADENGDLSPSGSGGIGFSFSTKKVGPLPAFSIGKPGVSDLRIVSYNVERDGFFEPNRTSEYSRIFKAIQPDIIGFQEIYNHTSSEVAGQLESILPAGQGNKWHHAMAEPDCHAISKYPILKSAQIPGSNGSGNGAFLIDVPNAPAPMLLLVAHPPCCGNNTARQMEVDQMMQFVRRAKLGEGPIPIEENAPIVILGDMNFVGDNNQVTTLLTGDIYDNVSFGSDFQPDWDGSDLIDSKPPTTGVPFSFTWYSENSSFSPGRLDYMVYTGSNLVLDNSYTLFTPGLPQDSLTKHLLLANDVVTASDHLPLVVDFSLKDTATVSVTAPNTNSLRIFPNPANDFVDVLLDTKNHGLVTIQLLDMTGKTIQTFEKNVQYSGKSSFRIFTTSHLRGHYILQVTTAHTLHHKRLVIAN
ncbi:MAG: T9SS type A sorting domain-containing protein [Bacteroidia bacterium]|nr:T9SS type A sorting domain-containing protein [Bacteroidia bacterium]